MILFLLLLAALVSNNVALYKSGVTAFLINLLIY